MRKTVLTFFAFLSLTSFAVAQSVQDGINFLYYERYAKAKETLQKVVSSNPKDAYAIYWLGQALLSDKDIPAAKALFQKALNEGVNEPYIWIGMGHVELLQGGDINQAKQKFEQAITTTKTKKGEDPNILNAIGRANADGGSRYGDPVYGVEKLKRAGDLDKTNFDIYYNMGVNYLKMGSDKGGDAYEAFNEAIRRNPKDARSMYRIGRIYESQANTDLMNEWYGKAVAADPNYAPAYLQWFLYYSNRDVNIAKEYLDKYMNVVKDDKTCEIDYFYADYLFRAGKYNESIAKAQEMENGNCKDFTKVHLLYAYSYDRLGDTIKARNAVEKYFASTPEDKILPEHYIIGASVLKRFPDKIDQAVKLLSTVYNIDTIRRNKMRYADTIAYIYRINNRPVDRLQWLLKSWSLNPNPSNFDIYNMGDAALAAKDYVLSDSMFNMYKNKYPDQSYGYIGRVKVAQAKDSSGAASVQPINDYIGYLSADTLKNKPTIIYYYSLLAQYFANTAKDYPAALEQFKKIQALDPSNADVQKYIDQLTKVINSKGAPAKPKTPATPKPPAKQSSK